MTFAAEIPLDSGAFQVGEVEGGIRNSAGISKKCALETPPKVSCASEKLVSYLTGGNHASIELSLL